MSHFSYATRTRIRSRVGGGVMMIMILILMIVQRQINDNNNDSNFIITMIHADTDNGKMSDIITNDGEDHEDDDMKNSGRSSNSCIQQEHQPQEISSILSLNDETFEHMTQASTGLTTGSWLIWFYNSTEMSIDISNPQQDKKENDPEVKTKESIEEHSCTSSSTTTSQQQQHYVVHGVYPSTEQWLDHNIVVAKIDVAIYGIKTMKRFFDRKDRYMIPTFIFIHNQGKCMYHVPTTTTTMTTDTPPDPQQQQPYFDWDSIYNFCKSPLSTTSITTALPIPPPPSILDETIEKLANNPSLFTAAAVMIMIIGAFIGTLIETIFQPKKKKTTMVTNHNNKPNTTGTTTTTTKSNVVTTKKKN